MTEQVIAIRTYRFQYGILHLELPEAKQQSTEDIIENYGGGKGPLLEVWDDEMATKEFYELEDFREL